MYVMCGKDGFSVMGWRGGCCILPEDVCRWCEDAIEYGVWRQDEWFHGHVWYVRKSEERGEGEGGGGGGGAATHIHEVTAGAVELRLQFGDVDVECTFHHVLQGHLKPLHNF